MPDNAALLCVQILAVTDEELAEKLDAERAENTAKILEKDREISEKYSG